MRIWLFVTLTLLVLACTAGPSEPGTAARTPNDTNTSETEQPRAEKLSAEIQGETKGETPLETTLHCNSTGGAISFTWSVNGTSVDCAEHCRLNVSRVGQYTATCTAASSNQRASDTVELQVLPRTVDVENVVVLGDSLSSAVGIEDEQGTWAGRIANEYEAEIHNYAVSGATSFNVREQQMEAFKQDGIRGNTLVFLWIGANDIKNFISLNDFRSAYTDVVAQLTNTNAEVILLTVPDASQLTRAAQVEQNFNEVLNSFGVESVAVRNVTSQVIKRYNAVIHETARQQDILAVDMFNVKNLSDSLVGEDGVHPNARGHAVIAQLANVSIREHYTQIRFE